MKFLKMEAEQAYQWIMIHNRRLQRIDKIHKIERERMEREQKNG